MNQANIKQQATQPNISQCTIQTKPKQKSKSKSKQKQKHILIIDEDKNQSQINESDKQRIRNKKYDYLNKYHQHQLLGKFYQKARTANVESGDERMVQTRKNFFQKRLQDRRSQDSRVNPSLSLPKSNNPRSQPKQNANIKARSNSKSSDNSQSLSQNKNTAYHHFLQAYQNNTAQQITHNPPHPYSPKNPQIIDKYSKIQHQIANNQNRLTKIVSRIPNIPNSLNAQITHQNQLYKNQINQYRTLVTRLQIELNRSKQQQIISQQKYITQLLQKDRIIKQLNTQIIFLSGYKQRYQILNEQMINMSMKVNNQLYLQHHHIHNNHANRNNQPQIQNKQNYRYENVRDDASVNRSFNKGKIKKVQQREMDNINNNNSIQKIIMQKIQAIMNGNKLKKNLCFQVSACWEGLFERIEKVVESNRKYENFIFNIKQMYKKIQKIQTSHNIRNRLSLANDPNIKQLWKWLKIIGSNYSFMLEVKPLLARKAGIMPQQYEEKQIRQILQLLLIKV